MSKKHVIILGLMIYIKFGIVFELFVYEIYGDSDGAFLCGTEILHSRLNGMDFNLISEIHKTKNINVSRFRRW